MIEEVKTEKVGEVRSPTLDALICYKKYKMVSLEYCVEYRLKPLINTHFAHHNYNGETIDKTNSDK